MRGLTILTATILTFGYGFAAQAAMTANRAQTLRRVTGIEDTRAPTAVEASTRVWDGGMPAPLTLEAAPLARPPPQAPLTQPVVTLHPPSPSPLPLASPAPKLP